MTNLMFEPITDEQEVQDTLNGRSAKGETLRFLSDAENAYQAYITDNPGGHFILPLNEVEHAKFFGKNTDSLYTTIYSVLKKNELTNQWRLVRVKKNDDTFLRLVHL